MGARGGSRPAGRCTRWATRAVPGAEPIRGTAGAVSRRLTGLALLALCASLATLALGAAPAGAEVAHVFSGSFPVPGSPVSIASDESSGDVYVLNTAGEIFKYSATGDPVDFTATNTNELTAECGEECRELAVDNSGGINQGVIYVSSNQLVFFSGGVRVFVPSGRQSTEITNAAGIPGLIEPFCGVTVDSAGVVYASHSGDNSNASFIRNIVNTYKPEQVLPDPSPAQIWPYKATFNNVANPSPCRMAVDSSSHLYITPDSASTENQFLGRDILRFTVDPFTDGEPSSKLVDSGSTGLAVDQSGNDLYSNHGTSIARFNEAGELRETFGAGQLAESGGVAVNGTNETVYAANRMEGNVQVFTAVATPNVDVTSAAPGQTTSTLTAKVDPSGAGDITGCEFEYGTTASYGTATTCAEPTPYSAEEEVSAGLSGLARETTFHYRVVVRNADGETLGPDETFTTHNVAGLVTGDPSDVTQTSATLNGSFLGDGEPVSYYFEWGPTAGYGQTTAAPPGKEAGEPTGPTSVSAPISGLAVHLPQSVPYHARLVAVTASGTTFGPDRTFFAAAPDAPAIGSVATGAVTPSTAALSAAVTPGNGPTVYWVEYGLESSYGAHTPTSESIGEDEAEHPVGVDLEGLVPGRAYHYRFVAANFGGVTQGPDRVFETPAPPTIAAVSSPEVGQTTASLEAQINPGFTPTSYRFEYGLTRSYGATTPEAGVDGAGNSPQPVRTALSGLRPGVTYHYRVVASNEYGTAEGSDLTLTTAPAATPAAPTTPQRPTRVKCPKGKVKKHGKCVKKPRHRARKHGRGSFAKGGQR